MSQIKLRGSGEPIPPHQPLSISMDGKVTQIQSSGNILPYAIGHFMTLIVRVRFYPWNNIQIHSLKEKNELINSILGKINTIVTPKEAVNLWIGAILSNFSFMDLKQIDSIPTTELANILLQASKETPQPAKRIAFVRDQLLQKVEREK